MAKTKKRNGGRLRAGMVPAYRQHKPSGRAIVTIGGKTHYLGSYGSPESREKYARLVAAIVKGKANEPVTVDTGTEPLTIAGLCLAFMAEAQDRYKKDGRPTSELDLVRRALRLLRSMHGSTLVKDFTAADLRAVRNAMIAQGWARKTVNETTSRIKRAFAWGVGEGLVPAAIGYELAQGVKGLRRGRSGARETEAVKPVDDSTIDATLPHLPRPIAAMVQFMRLAGCRPGEACSLKPCEVDRSGAVWLYRPASHKTQHHGRERVIPIGPRAQAVLLPFLQGKPDEFAFHPDRGERYGKDSFALAIRRGCAAAAGLVRPRLKKTAGDKERQAYRDALAAYNKRLAANRWHPNMLRHACGTAIRAAEGLEAARTILGHASASVSEIYAQRDLSRAIEVAEKMG